MANKSIENKISVNLTPEAHAYVEWLRKELGRGLFTPSKTEVINGIILGKIDVSQFPAPPGVLDEIKKKGGGK